MSAESETSISVRAIAATYDRSPILHGVDLDVPRGKVTALVGANGSGKSTLLKTIARVLPATSGTILLDGRDTAAIARRDFARRLTSLPQTPVAPEGILVRDLVRFGRHPYRGFAGRPSPDDAAAIEGALADAGLTDLADRTLDELSGGQRQRAWVAMALAQDTPVLLLDEPTTYLDMAHQTEVLRLLRRLNRQRGRTIVMVLHDLNQAARYSDHIVALRDGRVVAAGDPREVVVSEVIERVFGVACAVIPHPLDGTPLCLPHE